MSRSPQRPPNFDRRPAKPTLNPRRVVGGVRLQTRGPAPASPIDPTAPLTQPDLAEAPPGAPAEGATPPSPPPPASQPPASAWAWSSARWMRPVEDHAPNDQLAEGLDYARSGQTRSLDIRPGLIDARVQGRMPTAYRTAIRLPTFSAEQWDQVTQNMAREARFGASLLAGELPTGIEDLFVPLGLRLFPTESGDLSCSCSCDVFTGKQPVSGTSAVDQPPGAAPWCKHLCCIMYIVAERLGGSPLLAFALRGLPESDLLERLRQQRAVAGLQRTGSSSVSVYTPHVPGMDKPAPPLEDCVDKFWETPAPTGTETGGDLLNELDLPIGPPEITHPLLRRLGPSPFVGAKFPLVGLLATCYDVISAAAVRDAGEGAEPDLGPDNTSLQTG